MFRIIVTPEPAKRMTTVPFIISLGRAELNRFGWLQNTAKERPKRRVHRLIQINNTGKGIVNDAFSCIIKIMSSLQQPGLFIHSYNSVSDAPEENPLPSGRSPDPVVYLHTCRIKLIAGYKNHIEFVKSSVIIILI